MAKKKLEIKEPEIDLDFFRDLTHESDRGSVLLIGELMSSHLKNIHDVHIASKTVETPKLRDNLFSDQGPLGHFASRIKLAYSYGLISHADYLDLEILRGLRNKAAHCGGAFSFVSVEIQTEVAKINAWKRTDERFWYFEDKLLSGITPDFTPPANDRLNWKMVFIQKTLCLSILLLYIFHDHLKTGFADKGKTYPPQLPNN